ncbi:MAG: hypothetical protein WA741_19715 [Candidatus Sulfotelmatobacter sp.]
MIPIHPVSRKLILCVDDDEAILSYEKTLLERSGYSVIAAASAQQALGLGIGAHALMHSEDISYKPPSGEVELCRRVGRMGSIK